MELTELDREVLSRVDAQADLIEALLVVPPRRLRLLAKWFEQSDFLKGNEGTEIQDDLRKMADLSEKVLTKIKNEYETIPS